MKNIQNVWRKAAHSANRQGLLTAERKHDYFKSGEKNLFEEKRIRLEANFDSSTVCLSKYISPKITRKEICYFITNFIV